MTLENNRNVWNEAKPSLRKRWLTAANLPLYQAHRVWQHLHPLTRDRLTDAIAKSYHMQPSATNA